MNGAIVWRGRSLLDGSPIVVVVTGLEHASHNSKTGDMVQTWILVDGDSPAGAVRSGADRAICGDCKHRGTGNGDRTCYVNLATGLSAVGRTLARHGYLRMSPARMGRRLAGRFVRIGTYGDPAAVPDFVWRALISEAAGWTGYTHQWRTSPALADICMASVDTPWERAEAKSLGWRTFRVRRVQATVEPIGANEIVCPASAEAGHRLTCEECRLCGGTSRRAKDIGIVDHSTSGRARMRRLNVLQGELQL